MTNRTQLTAALMALLNGVYTILNSLGIVTLPPDVVVNINGFLISMVFLFLGWKVDRAEEKATTAAVAATAAEANSSDAATTAKRVEAAQPANGVPK